MTSPITDRTCAIPPPGWWCSRKAGHDGPCAARPNEDRLVEQVAEAIYPHLPAYMTMTSARTFARAAVSAIPEINEVERLREVLRDLKPILDTAESNASGNPEWEYVSKRVNAAREAMSKAEGLT